MAEVLDPETAPVPPAGPPELALRDPEGDLNPAFVETVAAAIAAGARKPSLGKASVSVAVA